MCKYAYFRCDFREENFDYYSCLKSVRQDQNIEVNNIIFEDVSANISFFYRDKIVNLVNFILTEGDTLIVKGIDSFGCDFKEIYAVLHQIQEKNVNIICVDFSSNIIKGDLKIVFFHFIKMCRDFEFLLKNERDNSIIKRKVGRPEILSADEKIEILLKFKKGYSIYSLAKEYAVTRSVIKRILNKAIE